MGGIPPPSYTMKKTILVGDIGYLSVARNYQGVAIPPAILSREPVRVIAVNPPEDRIIIRFVREDQVINRTAAYWSPPKPGYTIWNASVNFIPHPLASLIQRRRACHSSPKT
jgi:hypothetical protein